MMQGEVLRGVTVLVVEDHADTRETLTTALKGQGARVVDADSASVAFMLFKKHRPNIILTDLDLPDADGWEFLRVVRSLPKDHGGLTPAVALSGVHVTADARMRSVGAGFTLHLTKPYNLTELANILAALARAGAANATDG
jgi:CheY-like chemotaxis protein